jgi:sulfide:quinone oxidoreductase
MDIQAIDQRVSTTGQLTPQDIAQAALQGFRAIVCNRPDGEAGERPDHEVMAQAAQAQGLGFAYIPVLPSGATPDNVDVMARPQPISTRN